MVDVLAIAAHPDDVEQACGSTLLRMAEARNLFHRHHLISQRAIWARAVLPKSVSLNRRAPPKS